MMGLFVSLVYVGLCATAYQAIKAMYFNFSYRIVMFNGPLALHAITSLFTLAVPASGVHSALEKIADTVSMIKFRNVAFRNKCLFMLKMQNGRASLVIWSSCKIDKVSAFTTVFFIFTYSIALYEIDKSELEYQ
ncbi:uncharacterized protein CEXT_16641 [Caerostris extrusa]|uniref:Uncharacterized protein n=1 Tax=Caerostris extrusa TaxID=172846 RepID=A0AAV4Q8W1_CAEEX|nr:uncharacterized protein CEXT_16641 [Caerostris extrusa]